MSSYKLTYFNVTGLGEPIRFLLHYGSVDFEDNRVEFEEWPALKPKLPMEQMPVLEIDDKVYHQCRAIGRYLAKQFELYGSDDAQAMEIDMCVDDIEDWRLFYAAYHCEQDPTRKAELLEIANEKTPWFLAKFEEQVKNNDGFFVGGKMTWADIHFSAIVEFLPNVAEKEFIKDYPALQGVSDSVRSEPKIKAYLDERPETKF